MANSDLSDKLDIGLIMALRAYEESSETGFEDDAISVGLRFEGDLHAIEALGFETHSVSEQEARGMVRFKDVRKIAAHPGVLRISAGRPRMPVITLQRDFQVLSFEHRYDQLARIP
jgi:hypothetical protein